MGTTARVVAVVVAYNRRDLLGEALEAVRAQSVPPVAVLVVDNASTDGSAAMVTERFPEVELIRLERNTGGAGGFAVGLAAAIGRHSPDYVWLMDDDTIPEASALEQLLTAVTAFRGEVAIAGSRAVWTDGADHPMNTPRRRPFLRRADLARASAVGALPVRSSSFVSMLVAADEVRRLGLPVADYFIWNDDFEFSTRLLRHGVGLFVPSSVVVHKTKQPTSTDVDPGARFYYEVRNKLWMFRLSHGLGPFEKVLYGGSSLLRWVRTVRRSQDRRLLWRMLRRGLVDGIRTRPRPLAELVAGDGAGEAIAAQWGRRG